MTYNDDALNAEFLNTRLRGSLEDEYQIYCDVVDDGRGINKLTGEPVKTFDEWLDS